jgi:hypothetical protein
MYDVSNINNNLSARGSLTFQRVVSFLLRKNCIVLLRGRRVIPLIYSRLTLNKLVHTTNYCSYNYSIAQEQDAVVCYRVSQATFCPRIFEYLIEYLTDRLPPMPPWFSLALTFRSNARVPRCHCHTLAAISVFGRIEIGLSEIRLHWSTANFVIVEMSN